MKITVRIGRFLFLLLYLFLTSGSYLHSQVRTYPIFAVSQKATFGAYQSASQERIYHLSTEFTYVPGWNGSWSVLYRRTGLDYDDGFAYRQNQFTGSTTQVFPVGESFGFFRADLAYVSSNSTVTDKNFTAYGEVGLSKNENRSGSSFGGFFSHYQDVNSYGASALFWTGVSERSTLRMRINYNGFSGRIRNGENLLSGNISLYYVASPEVGVLFFAEGGRRSLFYESDIKLVYNTSDALSTAGGISIFYSPGSGISLLGDVTYERFEGLSGGTYHVMYLTFGGSVSF